MIVYNSEVVTMLVSNLKSTEQGLNRMDARKFALFNLNEHRGFKEN